jgi:hypothetical protein
MAVHDVEMVPVCTRCLGATYFVMKTAKVTGKEGRRYENGVH